MNKKEINKIKKLMEEIESVGNGKFIITDGENFFSGDEFEKIFKNKKNSMPKGIDNFLKKDGSMSTLRICVSALKDYEGDALKVVDYFYDTCKTTTECFFPLVKKDVEKQAKEAGYTEKEEYLKKNAMWQCYLDCIVLESLKLIRHLIQCKDVKNAKEVIVYTLEKIIKDIKEKEL